MKQLITIFFLMALWGNLYSQDFNKSDCLQYHKGNFTFIDSAKNVILVKRKKKLQVQTNQTTGTWTKFRIKWNNDCEYEIKQLGTNSKGEKKNRYGTTVVIISKPLGDAGYEYTCACKDPGTPKWKGVMNKVKD